MSLCVVCEILGLFVNALSADDKFSLGNCDNLWPPFQIQLSKNTNFFSWISCHVNQILDIFKTKMSSRLMYLRNYGLWKTLLDQCLKRLVSENPLRVNKLVRPKHCWNFYDSTFIIFSVRSERDWVGKCLSLWYVKS